MKKTGKRLTVLLLASALLLTGCAQKNTATDVIAEESAGSGTSNGIKVENLGSDATGIPVCTLDTTDMFSDRDKEVGFDENSDTIICLNGTSVSCDSNAVQIAGSTVTITDEGTYILSGTLTNGSIIVDAEDSDKLQLVLNGVDITCETSAAIYVKQADKVFLTVAPNTENSLKTTGEFVAIDDNNIDAAIFSKDDLTLNGSGSLQINCTYGHGIVSKDDLVITGGTYEITASSHGLSGKDSVRVAAGTVQITAGEDGIHSENDDDSTLGFVYVADGNITIAAGDDGIHAGNQVLLEGGTIAITESYEGIEGLTVDIAGGNVTVNSSDDGLNATDGSSSEGVQRNMPEDPFASTDNAYIKVSGGVLKVTAYGDGIDSNGGFYVTGGETYVSGPENSGNGSIDYAGSGQITGGIFVAAGSTGMAQNFDSNSTQCAMMVNLQETQSAGTSLSLKDADGTELVTFVPETKYSCVVISCPELQTGNTYTLTTGTESTDIEMTTTIYGSGMGGFGGGNGMGNLGGGPGGRENGGGAGKNGTGNMDGQKPDGKGGKFGNMDGQQSPENVQNGEQGTAPGGVPEGFDGEAPQMPEGGFDGEVPQMPEGGFDGEAPQMPEGGFNGEAPQMPGQSASQS